MSFEQYNPKNHKFMYVDIKTLWGLLQFFPFFLWGRISCSQSWPPLYNTAEAFEPLTFLAYLLNAGITGPGRNIRPEIPYCV